MDRELWADRFANAMLRHGAPLDPRALRACGRELWATACCSPERAALDEIESLAGGDRETFVDLLVRVWPGTANAGPIHG